MDDIGIEPVYLLKDRHIPAVTQETGANNLIVARGMYFDSLLDILVSF